MFHVYLWAYILIGLFVSGITMRVFPPMEGFQPKLGVRLLATFIFTTLWPVLVGLGCWYLGVGYLKGVSNSYVRDRNPVTFDTAHQIPVTKPHPK